MWKTIGSLLGTIVTVLGLVGFGYAIGDNSAEQYVQILQHERDQLRTEVDTKDAELSSLKQQLVSDKTVSPAETTTIVAATTPSDEATKQISVARGSSAVIFDVLRISVIEFEFSGNPLRHRAILNVSSKDKPTATFKDLDVGAKVEYDLYQIEVTGIDFPYVYLSVTRKPAAPNSSQKLSRPGAGPPAEPARQHTRMGGVTAVAGRQSWLHNSSAATAVPRRLRHVGPGRAA